MAGNNPPKTFWSRSELACGIVRHRLYIDGNETPYFIDDAKHAGRCHYQYGERIALMGAGMGAMVDRRRVGGGGYRIAAFLGGFRRIELAKSVAEQRALT
jgi:hypothetical protein